MRRRSADFRRIPTLALDNPFDDLNQRRVHLLHGSGISYRRHLQRVAQEHGDVVIAVGSRLFGRDLATLQLRRVHALIFADHREGFATQTINAGVA